MGSKLWPCVSASLFCQWSVWVIIAQLVARCSTVGEVLGWNHFKTPNFFSREGGMGANLQ